jgi:Fe-Mn family superoxide dismutase
MENKYYSLPNLDYEYNDLEPYISEVQLQIHHTRHHQGYVNGANNILKNVEKARKDNVDLDMKSTLKALSFNIGGHILHSLFWPGLTSPNQGGGKPGGLLDDSIEKEFGSFNRFKNEFSISAASVEGSGWGALSYCKKTDRPIIMQIEKHNINVYPTFEILMVLDVWEHAYYLDYKNARGSFIEAFWNIVNWETVEKRLEAIM